MHVTPVFWSFAEIVVFAALRDNKEVECKCIDWVFILSSVILKNTRQEGLGKEESRDPVVWRSAILDPFLHELESLNEIIYPAA